MYNELDRDLQKSYRELCKARDDGKTINDIIFAPMEPYEPSEFVKEQSRLQAKSHQIACEKVKKSDIVF
jgi:hypothetical protein